MKVLLVVISARASYSRIRSLILQLKESNEIHLKVALMASAAISRYGKVDEFLVSQGVSVDWRIESQFDVENSSSMVKTTANSMLSLADYLCNLQPDGILVIADRHETIAVSICGAYLGIKTFHIQGGERTGNIDDRVRFANSFLSDFHLVANQNAKDILLNCGINAEKIFITGCPSLDFIDTAISRKLPALFNTGVGKELNEVLNTNYAIVIQHCETTSRLSPSDQIRPTLEVIQDLKLPSILIWPNADFGSEEIIREIRKMREKGKLENVHFAKSFEPEIFIKILSNAACIIGNSSVGVRECSFLGIPAVDIGTRQVKRITGENVIHVKFDYEEIRRAVTDLWGRRFRRSTIYGDGNAAFRILECLKETL